MNRLGLGIALGVVLGFGASSNGTGAAQLVPMPSPAPGVTHVNGEVVVTNKPTVLARQDGTWTVTCAPPTPPFGKSAAMPGENLTLTYVDGAKESIKVDVILADGWIAAGRRRINLANVIAIEPQR